MTVDDERAERRARALGMSLTVAAVALVVVHLVWPDLRIDSVTLVLLAVALLPWLGPLFKSIELPGGWKFEFQEFKHEVARELENKDRQVAALANRVEDVERAIFVGDIDRGLQDRLTTALGEYHAYLQDLALTNGVEPPKVTIDSSARDTAFYLGAPQHEIHIGESIKEDVDRVLRLYTLHVLGEGESQDEWASREAVRAGLGYYFPCSFRNTAKFGEITARVLKERRGGEATALDLGARASFEGLAVGTAQHTWSLRAGWVWASVLWEVREAVGPAPTDRAAADGWQATTSFGSAPVSLAYGRAVLAALDSTAAGRAGEIFSSRGLDVGGEDAA